MKNVTGLTQSIFICPECGSPDHFVCDSRDNLEGTVKLRRRCCRNCGARWDTIELMRSEFDGLFEKSEKYNEEEVDNLLSSLTAQLIKANALVNTIYNRRKRG